MAGWPDGSRDLTQIFSEKQRRAPIPKGKGICFRWNDFEQMHTTTLNPGLTDEEDEAQAAAAAAEKHLQDQAALIARIFGNRKEVRRSHLTDGLKEALGCAVATAQRRFSELLTCGLIERTENGLYAKGKQVDKLTQDIPAVCAPCEQATFAKMPDNDILISY